MTSLPRYLCILIVVLTASPVPGANGQTVPQIGEALADGDIALARELWRSLPAAPLQYSTLAAEDAHIILNLATGLMAAGWDDDAREVWEQSGSLEQRLQSIAFTALPVRDMLHSLRRAGALCEELGNQAEAQAVAEFIQEQLASTRIVKVVAAADSKATQDPQWRQKIRDRIRYCSKVLKDQFGIHLQIVATLVWDAPEVELSGGPSGFVPLLADLAETCPLGYRDAELILGFLSVPLTADGQPLPEMLVFGMAPPQYRGYAVVRDISFYARQRYQQSGRLYEVRAEWTLTPEAVRQTLLHEIGHAFGCLHTDAEGSVMRPGGQPAGAGLEFDTQNAAVIAAAKWMDIARGPYSLDEPELVDLLHAYHELEGACAEGNGAELCEAECYLALGELYEERGQLHEARHAYQSMLDLRQRVAPHVRIVGPGGKDMMAAAAAQAEEALAVLTEAED